MAENTVPVTFKMVGLNDLKDANRTLKQMSGPSGSVSKTTKSTTNFGFAAQNAGYQVQDLIVQIQGGQDPMRALGQQLPQMTVGFGLWGAAIGVVAAALPALITAMRDTDDQAGTLTDTIASLNTNFDILKSRTASFDMKEFVDAWSDAADETGRFYENALKITQLQLDNDIRTLTDSINDQVSAFNELSLLQRAQSALVGVGMDEVNAEYAKRANIIKQLTENMQEEFDLNKENARELVDLNRAFADGTITIEQYADDMFALAAGTSEANNEFTELAISLQKYIQLQKERAALADPGSGFQEIETTAERIRAPGGAGSQYDERDEEVSKFLKDRNEAIESMEEGAKQVSEAWSAQAEIFSLVNSSFDSMVDGVVRGTRTFEDAIVDMSKVVIAQLLKIYAIQTIMGLAPNSNFSANLSKVTGVQPFAKGGVVNSPTLFPMSSGVGLMGEAGPEAIIPLQRNSSGDLGVSASPVSVTVNNMAPGVDVQARQDGGGLTIDVIMRNVESAIRQGGNGVSNALEQSYSLGRGRGVY